MSTKRALVEYASSEEENETPTRQQNLKKRKLPPLSPSLTVPTPVDNPALHQGRLRTVPHVEGQYAAYIYVPLVLHHRDALFKLVVDALALARAHVPSLQAIGKQDLDPGTAEWELHISLSRPLFLRAHQREEFRQAIRQVASSIAPFDASFATFSDLTNDTRTRTFLALQIGAGHRELLRCLDFIAPTLRLLRHEEFYVDPKFHASIAWALLQKTHLSPNAASLFVTAEENEIASTECSAPDEHSQPATPRVTQQLPNDFKRIPHFPITLVPALNETYAAKLSQAQIGGFLIDRIAAKIGKDIFTWPLTSMK